MGRFRLFLGASGAAAPAGFNAAWARNSNICVGLHNMKKNVAGQKIGAQMVATDGSAFTGTVTVYVTVDAGSQGVGTVGSGVCTHEGNGYHTYAPSDAETNGDLLGFTFIGTGAVPTTVQVSTGYPQTGDTFVRVGAPAGASLAADILVIDNFVDDLETLVAAVKAKTDNLPADPADDGDIDTQLAAIAGYLDTEVAAILAAVDTEVAAIKTKTDYLPSATAGAAGGVFIAGSNAATSVTTALTANITGNLSGSVGSVTGAVGGNVTGSVGSLATQAKADVNAEVVDALATDTYAEPGQGAPAATATLAAKLNYLYKAWRNKKVQDATTWELYADNASTVDQKAAVSDDGTDFTVGEIASGA